MNKTVHKIEEFASCPLLQLSAEELKSDKWKGLWSYAFGGYGMENKQMHLYIVNADLDEDIWPVPAVIQECVESSSICAVNTRLGEIKMALDI